MSRTYRITHRTSYSYDGDVTSSFGRAHLLPLDRPGQRCLDAAVVVTPAPAELRDHTDYFGNRSTYFAVTTPHRELTVLGESTVVVEQAPPRAPAPPWEAVRDRLAARSAGPQDPELLDARSYALPSPRLGPLPAAAAYTRPSFAPDRPIDEAVIDLATRIHHDFRFVSGSTTVGSTVADLLEHGKGVCQDFAHLAVSGLRAVGLAARYVSGYLETTPPPGRKRLVGADASHAWVSVFTGSRWLDVDPTNDRVPDLSYVELAHGRDYADVPPLKGVIFSDATESVMRVGVDMVRLAGG
jgi:transglutaminase-like putative cysteine protease